MAPRRAFSNALRITDLNDFLSPSASCVLPLGGGALPDKSADTALADPTSEPAGSVLAPIVPVQSSASVTSAKAKVTVSDCLACTGCVTSAETVLLSTESVDELKRVMIEDARGRALKYTVAALSQQAVASIAVHYGLQLATTARKLSTFLRWHMGFDAVVDLSFVRHFSLLEAAEEFVQRYEEGNELTIASACPGWVTYAEKTQGRKVLDCISAVRSPQGMLGVFAKTLRPTGDTRTVWSCAIMPCHDKKLEANRPEFIVHDETGAQSREVSCVLTAGELLELIREQDFKFEGAKESLFDEPFQRTQVTTFGVAVGSGSGGYADFVLRIAAQKLLRVSLPAGPLRMEKASKSGDLQSITVSDESGSKNLRFALAYGFRSLQSVLRKIRRGECTYNYIELMACPGGCTNGGGLLEVPNNPDETNLSLKQQASGHAEAVNRVFAQAPHVFSPFDVPNVRHMYEEVVRGNPGSLQSKKRLGMSIRSRKRTSNVTPASLDW